MFTSYSQDPNGNTVQRVDGRNWPTTYTIDALTECGCLPIRDIIGNGGNAGNYGGIVQCLQNSPDPCSCLGGGLNGTTNAIVARVLNRRGATTENLPHVGVTGPGGPGTSAQAMPGVGSLTPPAVPASGPGIKVTLEETSPLGGNISGFPIYIAETGVTLVSTCAGVTFYSTAVETVHIILGTSEGQNCNDLSVHSYSGSGGSANTHTPPLNVSVFMTRN